ncbi:MAG: hypothetical protein K0R84_2775 [Clostridia bacterium]|nr:hypothetical protein [Clostridia bacterium]
MKKSTLFFIGLGTFIACVVALYILIILFEVSSGDEPVNASMYNSGVWAIVCSIDMLSAIIVVCTIVIVNNIKKLGQRKK